MTTWLGIVDPIVQNLIASAIYGSVIAIVFLIIRATISYSRAVILSQSTNWLVSSAFISIMSMIFIYVLDVYELLNIRYLIIIYILTLITLIILGYKILYHFTDAGIFAAYEKIAKGIEYSKALSMIHSRLDFLGIGAHKLTTDPEFVKAMDRISRGGSPVRLLLSSPENPILRSAANRAGVGVESYKERVSESLSILATLKSKKGYNIEVRFYPAISDRDYQQFRLMFIDNRVCLFNHTVWDNSGGENNPQIILVPGVEHQNRKIYSAFYDHFERLWSDKSTVKVDLSKYGA